MMIYIAPMIGIKLAIFTIISAIFVLTTDFENTRTKRFITRLLVSLIT